MKRTNLLLACIAVSAFSFVGQIVADDWPQWQGTNRDGVSTETGLMQEWPKGGPPLAWKIDDLGGGYSSPAVVDGKLYGMSTKGDDEIVWCLSESDGSQVWSTRIGPAVKQGARQGIEGTGCTPTVDGDNIYVLGFGGTLACLSTKDGKVAWTKNLVEDFGGIVPTWRYNESPLIDGEKLICTPGGPEASIVALNKNSGETIWKMVLASPSQAEGNQDDSGRGRGRRGRGRRGPQSGAGYASAIAIDFEGKRQYVQLLAKSLVGVDAETGEMLWSYDRPSNPMGITCSTPVHKDGYVFAASAYGSGGGLAKLKKGDDGKIVAEQVYDTSRMQNHHGGMIVHEGVLYGAAGGNSGGFLRALDFMTGEVGWSERDAEKGSIAMADGRIYLRSEDGTMFLIEPNANEYVEKGQFEQPDRTRSPTWAHPVIANGKMYLRDQGQLFCYDIKQK